MKHDRTVFWLRHALKLNMHYSNLLFKARKGFTLIELMVVIAIILFLAALLMPSLQRAVETARVTKCMSNIRQIGQATFVYASDYNGFPPYHPRSGNYRDYGFFVSRRGNPLYDKPDGTGSYPKNKWFPEYLGSATDKMAGVAYCPAGGRLGRVGPEPKALDNPTKTLYNCSYAINGHMITDKWFFGDSNNPEGSSERACVPLHQIQYPAQVCLWIEGQACMTSWKERRSVSGRHFSNRRTLSVNHNFQEGGYMVYEERGKAAVLYVDQHITFQKHQEEIAPSSHRFWEHTETDLNSITKKSYQFKY